MASSDPPTHSAGAPVALINHLVIDCLDLERSARFWGSLLGLRPGRRLDHYLFMGSVLPGCELVLQRVDHVPTDKSPIHFDIGGSDLADHETIVALAERLGGTIVRSVEEAGYTLVVMTDPDGNEFCVNRLRSGSSDGRGPESAIRATITRSEKGGDSNVEEETTPSHYSLRAS